MPVIIKEIVSEVSLTPEDDVAAEAPSSAPEDEQAIDRIVRLATRQVIERLRLEWER